MPPRSRSVLVILGALASVILVVAGSSAAAGGGSRDDGRRVVSAAPPGTSVAVGAATEPTSALVEPTAAAVEPTSAVVEPTAAAVEPTGAPVPVPVPVASMPPPPDAARDPAIRTRDGALAARGSALTVERVDLDAVTSVQVRGVERDVSAVYRVTVSAGPYVMRDLPAVLAVDGTALGVAAESEDLAALVLYTYDEAVLSPGATLSLSYGLPGMDGAHVAPVEWSTTIEAAA